MSDLLQRLSQARDHLQLDWPPERAEHNRRAVLVRKRRRTAIWTVALLVLVGIGVTAGRAFWARRGPAGHLPAPAIATVGPVRPARPAVPEAPVPASPSSPPAPLWTQAGTELRFRDGSRATLLHEGSRLSPGEDAPGRTVLKLLSGGARFDVVHDPARVFQVDTPGISVEVLGTRFSMERTAAGLRVTVEQGRVRVVVHAGRDGHAGTAELTDGQDRLFPAPAPDDGGAAQRPRVPPRPDWRALAEEGQFERAYHGLSRRPLSEVSDEPGELLILADVARLSHHPAQAVPPLRKVVDAHPDDPRAPLAAFTMGRVLLDDLGQPKQAAAAFSRLQGLDPGGPMAEDALAREVEAWSRAGDVAQARRRAEDYLMRYPDGRRLRSVRRYGGLD